MKAVTTITRTLLIAGVLALVATGAMAQVNDLAVGKAKEFIGLLQKGDFNGAYGKVDSNLGFKASPDTFKAYWQNLINKAGNFVEYKEASVENKDGVMVVTQVVKFEKGHVDLKVALDNSLKVSGFQYTNHKASEAHASASAQPPAGGAPAASPQAQAQPKPAAAPPSPST